MKKINSEVERHWCFNCEEFSLHTVQYSKNGSKSKRVCPLCKHISFWSISVYPNPPKEDTNKQINYILKDIEQHIKEP